MPRFAENKKSSNIGAKMHYLGIFKVALEKNTVMFDAGTPTFFSECKLSCNTKELQIWSQIVPYPCGLLNFCFKTSPLRMCYTPIIF